MKIAARSMISRSFARICLCAGALLTTSACSSEGSAPPALQVGSGSLAMPLITTVDASTYRLDASIFIQGPTFTIVSTTADPGEDVLRVALQTGQYTAFLQSWALQKQQGDGSFAPVQATLVSSPSPGFSIDNGATTTISFDFQTDGVVVKIGQGNLLVNVGVEEIPPVCTPLGTDCAPGFWCPPPELTGAPVACVTAGAVEVGQPCAAPSDCVANASCLDVGAGPVCVALCATSALGEACESGGTCQTSEAGYGVCR